MSSERNVLVDVDLIDWSQYPPDRVEGLKYFYKGPSSDEDGPPTEDELKMMCLKWHCRVDMKIDNYLFWFMRKWFLKFNSDKQKFDNNIPKLFDKINRRGVEGYNQYHEENYERNVRYIQKFVNWRQMELRRLRYMDKLEALCSQWSWSDNETESFDDSDDFTEYGSEFKYGYSFSAGSISSSCSVNTVINTQERYNNYLETPSLSSEKLNQEEISSETFLPASASTQESKLP